MKISAIFFLFLFSINSFTASAGVYEFKKLFNQLGYPSPTYFGASEEEVQDLENYTSKEDTYYKEINSYLRYFPQKYDWYGIGPADAKVMVNHIDQIFNRVPSLPSDLILFRGVDLKFRGNKSFRVGEEFVEKGYLSTSTSFKIAKYFAVEINREERITSKKAIFAFYINKSNFKGILFNQDEDEVILEHGEKIRVMAVKNTNNTSYDFYLAQICAQTCEVLPNKEALEVWEHTNN